MKKLTASLCALAMAAASAWAQAAELRADHPDSYIVQQGDTLWDIAGRFLTKPWQWPEIWQANPQVENPHLIYPGDQLSLVYVDGQPRLVLGKRVGGGGTLKLSPGARILSQGQAVTTLPLDVVQPFLVGARIVGEDEYLQSAYVVGTDGDRLATGLGDQVYVRGLEDTVVKGLSFFRKGGAYVDPETEELLGFEGLHLGSGQLVRGGDPSTVAIKRIALEILEGDRLMPTDEQHLRPVFLPHAVKSDFAGRIISVYGGVSQIGQYNVVVLNRGEREGVEVGHVMTVFRKGDTVMDDFAKEHRAGKTEERGMFQRLGDFFGGSAKEAVALPDEPAGELMVFRTFDKVSLALVMAAKRPIHVLDAVRPPE
ncbi:MAG: LysM peptidoglycan-binding domain-containing protein [Gammaproteobacteria bacterium]|nr:LysM peptidoglycan-binding domain-containing protein [Gammaproteobacteria bacterium]